MKVRSSERRQIIIAAGGTAGHVLPAIALANVLSHQVHVSFFGGGDGFESLLVPAAGFAFEALEAQRVFGSGVRRVLRVPFVLGRAFAHARAHFVRSRPALVVGFGGHAAVAPLLAARALGIPTAIYEANVDPGLANRFLSPWVDRVHVASAGGGWSARRKTVSVGIPICRALDRPKQPPRTLPDRRALHVLVLGGSQGSSFLNHRVPALMAALRARGVRLSVWHQAGLRADVAAERKRYANSGLSARVDGYLPDLGEAYRWADFAISAAGAGSLAELSAMALPALLVPLAQAASNHQLPNALAYAEQTGAFVCEERAFDARVLAEQLHALLRDAERYGSLSARALRMHQPGAAARLAASCLSLASGHTQVSEAPSLVDVEMLRRMPDNDVAKRSANSAKRSKSARVHKA